LNIWLLAAALALAWYAVAGPLDARRDLLAPPPVPGFQGEPAVPTATRTRAPTPVPPSLTPPSTEAPVAVYVARQAATRTTTPVSLRPPIIVSVSPNRSDAVNPLSLTVQGLDFYPGYVVELNNRPLQTTFLSPVALLAIVPGGLPAGTYDVRVVNPLFPGIFTVLPRAFTIASLSSEAFIPLVARQSSVGTTGIQVQNLSQTVSAVYLRYYDREGNSDPAWAQATTVSPGVSVTLYQGDHPSLPIGFEGSAVVQSQQPIDVVVNRVTEALAPGLGGPAVATSSMTSFRASVGPLPQEAIAPLVFGGFNGYASTVSIQNTSAQTAPFSLSLYPAGSTIAETTVQLSIPPLGLRRVRITSDLGLAPGFMGGAVIRASVGGVSAVVESYHPVTGILFSYTPVASGAPVQHAPLLFKNAGKWASAAQVVNVSGSEVVVNAALRQRGELRSFVLKPATLRPNESYTYYLPATSEVPDGFVGAGTFSATGPIALVVLGLNADRWAATAYTGNATGTPNVSLPLLFKSFNGWDTGVQVFNTGIQDTNVTLTYFLSDGSAVSDVGPVAAGDSATFYQPASPALPAGFVGAGLVTSTNGQPIVAVVNMVSSNRPGDSAGSYEGHNF
jgi:hypothetical protein